MNNHPLGFTEEAWSDLTAEERHKAAYIQDFDLRSLSGDRLQRHGISNRLTHDAVLLEVKRFLCVKVLRDPTPMGCFGLSVAAAWHAFILDTQLYEEFCANSYGKTIHHKPSNYGVGVQDNTVWMSFYRTWYGKFPSLWKVDLDGQEIPGIEFAMNVTGNVPGSDQDSDDGAFAVINP